MDIVEVGHSITLAACELWAKVLEKFGKHVTEDCLKDATKEEKDAFIDRLKQAQTHMLSDRLNTIFNRVLIDYHFVRGANEIMASAAGDLKQDIEILNNQLQSIENESSTLQRDIDTAVDKLEELSEELLRHKIIT